MERSVWLLSLKGSANCPQIDNSNAEENKQLFGVSLK